MRLNLHPIATSMVAVPAFALGMAFAAPDAAAADFTAELMAPEGEAMPEGQSAEVWMEASGEARATAENGEHVVEFEASDLVPDGLYTIWWVNPTMIGMDMGPGGGVPDNEFRADSDGNAEVTLRVAEDNDYNMMVVVYHADDMTHGEEPGEMGSVTFEHLTGPWPGPEGDM